MNAANFEQHLLSPYWLNESILTNFSTAGSSIIYRIDTCKKSKSEIEQPENIEFIKIYWWFLGQNNGNYRYCKIFTIVGVEWHKLEAHCIRVKKH